MASDSRLSHLSALLSELSAPIRVLTSEAVPNGLPIGVVTVQGNTLYLRLRQAPIALSCPANTPGGADLLRLAGHLAASAGTQASEAKLPDNPQRVYRQILDGSLHGPALKSAAMTQHLPEILPRCVLYLRLPEGHDSGAWDELRELIPTQKRDALVPLGAEEAALIKDLTDEDTAEEVSQYAEALHETLLGEAGQALSIGIGERFENITDIAQSMRQARQAVEIGQIFRPDAAIHSYSRLQLERLLAQVPPDISEECQRSVFNSETAKLLDAEMLATLDAFFRKDLNLSDTARQLYIHRNTLVYRLDKVQRQTGLDLRSFDDAVTFKVLLALRQYTEATRKP